MRYINADDFLDLFYVASMGQDKSFVKTVEQVVDDTPTADVVEVADVSEQIIRKNAEVSKYWQNDVKQYRAMKGYSDIEHDVDNFLRGYNEAVEDMLAILDGKQVTE